MNKQKKQEIAIEVKNVSKDFIIPHQKVDSMRGFFTGMFRKRTFERFDALKDISFEVKKGEFFGIIGRNGSGKSTLLKILAGIYVPNKGSVKINGRISPFLELGIGFNPELSGRDNVYLNATVLGLTQKQVDEKFDEIVRFAELEQFIDEQLKNYSSGMQVRLAFAVSIFANREILLMDEVLAVGDSNFQSKCLEEFAKYRQEGRTVIIVTHDISVVQRYCDRAMLLRKGKIEMIGDPEKVGNKYVYQNMSDEERRLIDEEREKAKRATNDQQPTTHDGSHSSVISTGDEAKSRGGAEKSPQHQKTAEMTKVEFLDKDGKKKNVFQTGEDLCIRIWYRKKEKGTVLNFGVALFDIEHSYIFGINSFVDEVNIQYYLDKEHFDVLYDKIPLRTGTFYVKAGLWGDKQERLIDFLDRSPSFKVYSLNKNEGLVDLKHSWLMDGK